MQAIVDSFIVNFLVIKKMTLMDNIRNKTNRLGLFC